MDYRTREIGSFFHSQAFADGLRATFAILVPALAGWYLGNFNTGLTIALGAMCVSLTDAPGPLRHRRIGMMFSLLFIFLVSMLTSYMRLNIYAMSMEVGLVCFFFSMLNVYGARAGGVGNAAILVMILSMDDVVQAGGPLEHAVLLVSGGAFYMILSLTIHILRPYRVAQRIFGESIREVAHYLLIKSEFYDLAGETEPVYRRMIARQVIVHEKQDAVREVFFKTRQIVREATPESKRLIYSFVAMVDLFEEISASVYDYDKLRRDFGNSGALEIISAFLKQISSELDNAGLAIQNNESFAPSFDYDEGLRQLKRQLDATDAGEPGRLVLSRIVVNIRAMLSRMHDMLGYFRQGENMHDSPADHSRFITHQSLGPGILRDNLTLDSSVFRHSLRVAISCVAGYLVAKLIGYGEYTYWILLTIAFIMKPAFSLTRERNVQRFTGTLAGGAIGVLVLAFIPDRTAQFIIMVFFMAGTYSFLRINYLAMVIFTTPYIIILFSLLGAGFREVAQERILDTAIGCVIALSGGYFLFPRWESYQIRLFMPRTLEANAAYMEMIVRALLGERIAAVDYRLARKNVYLNLANLSAAFQRMLSEPRNKQIAAREVHQFVVLSHILFSNMAAVASALFARQDAGCLPDQARQANKCVKILQEAKSLFMPAETDASQAPECRGEPGKSQDGLLKQQIEFISSVCHDILRLSRSAVISLGLSSADRKSIAA